MVAAALWDVLAKVANLAQLSGVHAVTLLGVALSLLRIPQCMRERVELERCACRLRALMQELLPTIAGGCEIVARHSEMVGLVRRALREADELIGSYDESTLWDRLWTGRSMAGELRDVHSRVESCCFLVQFAHAYVLTQAILPPPSDVATSQGNVEPPAATVAETSAVAAAHQRANDIGREGLGDQTDDTDPGYEIETVTVISNE